jgi:hypothetical protein
MNSLSSPLPNPACVSCGGSTHILLDLGPQPPSNRFVEPTVLVADSHPLVFGQCSACGLLQLLNPMPLEMVRPRVDWASYREPESHLDDLAQRLSALPGLSPIATVGGITHNDDSLAARLIKLGVERASRLSGVQMQGLSRPAIGLETEQAVYVGVAAHPALRSSQDLLLVRHVIEHAHDPVRFAKTLASLVKPGGYLVFEVPACGRFVASADHSFLWEEHVTYFSPRTLIDLLHRAGLSVVQTLNYPFALEDSLVCIASTNPRASALMPQPNDSIVVTEESLSDRQLPLELAAGQAFASRFDTRRIDLHGRLEHLRSQGKRVALFGASHLGTKFVNFFQLAPFLIGVIDDNPHKAGLTLPGSRLPIIGSDVLERMEVEVCLLALSPESEAKVLAAKQDFTRRGGTFCSVFPLSPIAFELSPR